MKPEKLTTTKPGISSKDKSTASTQKRRCIFCGQEAELIWVHGHGQCAACGTNAEECCRGENCSF